MVEIETVIGTLSTAMRLIPDRLPAKARVGRMLLHPFLSQKPAFLRDRAGCSYVLPSNAEPIAEYIFTFGAHERNTQNVILEFLSEKGTFIDVGANIGAIAIPIAKLRPQASASRPRSGFGMLVAVPLSGTFRNGHLGFPHDHWAVRRASSRRYNFDLRQVQLGQIC